MLEQLTVGWTQLRSVQVTADTPPTLIEIPNLSDYRKYCLVLPAAAGVSLVTANQTVSTLIGGSSPKPLGIWDTAVRFWASAAAPTPVVITPFASSSGEMLDLPVFFPAVAAVISGQTELAQYTAAPGQTVFTLPHTPSSSSDVMCFVNGQGSVNGTDFTIAGNIATWLNISYSLNGDDVQFFYQI